MSECFRCGQEGHHRRDCPRDEGLPAAPPQLAAALYDSYPPAWALRRAPEEISGPTPEYLAARERLQHRMPEWLWRRVIACQQVAESRQRRLADLDF